MKELIFGEAGSKARTYIPMEHPAHVGLLHSALDLVEETLATLAGRPSDRRGTLAVALFVRMREFVRAASELLLYGQQSAASVQLRAAFEVLVCLKSCCERPEFEAEFSGATWGDLRQMAQARVDNLGGLLSEAQRAKWAERKREYKAAMSTSAVPRLKDLACKAGLEAWYAYFYKMSSQDAHSTFFSLVLRHLDFGEEGTIIIDSGPKSTEFRMLSGILAEHVMIATEAVLSLYKLEAGKRFVELRQQHQQLVAEDVAYARASAMTADGTGNAT